MFKTLIFIDSLYVKLFGGQIQYKSVDILYTFLDTQYVSQTPKIKDY